MEAILVITNLPDEDAARRLAERLVAERVAACVNVLAPCNSVYRWQGAVESAREVPLLIKTLRIHYDKVERLIVENHPYELPEVIAVPIAAGLPAYLQWVAQETTTGSP